MVKIAVDAGHGLHTSGKRTPAGEREWTFNNKVVKALINKLNQYEGVQVLRLDDPTGKVDVGLLTRTNKANRWGADALVSVHHNADKGVWADHGGTETYTQFNSSRASVDIAKLIHKEIVTAMGLQDRGLKTANFSMTRNSNMPAVLTEGGFMDSRKDIIAMRDDSKMIKQGESIANALAKYFKLTPKKNASVSKPTPAKPASKPAKPAPSKPASGVYTGGSLVDYLKSIGKDTSFNSRKGFAKEYGISNYTGTASQNTALLSKMRSGDKPKVATPKPVTVSTPKSSYTGASLTDYLKSINVNSSFSNRSKLASQYGISNYKGTASQNSSLLSKMRSGKPVIKTLSISQMASKIINNKNAPSGHEARMKWLGIDSSTYQKVRAEVNKRF